MVKETPILMSPRSMKYLLAGTKTQTRRIVKSQPEPIEGCEFKEIRPEEWAPVRVGKVLLGNGIGVDGIKCPFGTKGDELWIKETFWTYDDYKVILSMGLNPQVMYRAGPPHRITPPGPERIDKWKPSLFMPRWASRFNPKILSIRMERIQDITEADAIAEGCKPESVCTARDQYKTWWTQLNDKPKPIYKKKQIIGYESYPWGNIHVTRLHKDLPCHVYGNPWVWVVEFEKVV